MRPITKKTVQAAIIVALTPLTSNPTVMAKEALSPLIITAGRISEDPARISSDVSIITEKEIRQSQALTVAELLKAQVGLDVVSQGGAGKVTSVFIRGGNSGHTLVLIDGVRVGSATTGMFDWGFLSTADIERIEIVRGAQSSLYGADAMGGVVQIFTRKGKRGVQITTSAEAGSYGTTSESLSLSGLTEAGVDYTLSASGMETDGVSAAASGTERDSYRQTSFSGRVGIPVGDGNMELVIRQTDGNNGLDGWGPSDTLNYTSDTKQTLGSVKFSYPISDTLDSSLQLSRSKDKVISRDPATAFNNSDFRTQIDQLTWQNHLNMDNISLLFGVDIHHDKGVSSSSNLDNKTKQTAGFASIAWSTELVDMNASIRHDRNSASTNKTTHKFGAVLHPLDGLKLSANYGTGFKSPSINDLYFPTTGNPDLRPETSRGWDAGINYESNNKGLDYSLSAVWFSQRYRDLIRWAPIAPGSWTWSPANIDAATSRGLELSGRFAYGPAYIHAGWTFLNAKNSADGSWLTRRAKDSGSVVIGADISGLHAEAMVNIVGPRFSAANNSSPMAGYHKSDIRISYAISDIWTINGRIENIEDKIYEEVDGYGVPGRAWYGGVKATF